MEKHTLEERKTLKKESQAIDKPHFAEQRTNLLLYHGDHYKAKAKKFLDRNKDKLSDDQKLRLQENHIQKISNDIITGILNEAPGVRCVPANENELRDQKDAELTQAVIDYAGKVNNIELKLEKLANDFVNIGEMFAMVVWNPMMGKLIGYEQATTDDGIPLFVDEQGQPTPLEMGLMGPNQPMQGEAPIFDGELEIKIVHGYNVYRDKAAETIEESPWLCIDTLVSKEEAEALLSPNVGNREEVLAKIRKGGQDAFKVFEPSTGEYIDSKDQVLVEHWLFRPCEDYPNGHFYLDAGDVTLNEGELPFGVWPMVNEGFVICAGSPRAKSYIPNVKPAQVELNRLISQQALHTIVLADDKIITTMGGKINKGANWSGVREFNVTGPGAVSILPGRDGAQFFQSIDRARKMIYELSPLEGEKEIAAQSDAWAILYSKLSQKKKLSPFARKFERFLVKLWEVYIELARNYYPDDKIIKAVGKREAVNIAEFKAMSSDGYRVNILPANTDLESMMGKSLQIQQMLQYIGKDLPDTVKARLGRLMPFMNETQALDELLIDDENIDSDILALDRGEFRPALKNDKHELYIKRLTHRTKQNDFRMLDPQIQQMYEAKIKQHTDMQAQLAQELKELEAQYIPTDGALVKTDIYGSDGKRISFPYAALQWLIGVLEKQGMGQQQLDMLDQSQQVEVLKKAMELNNQQGMGSQPGTLTAQPMPLT